MPHTLNQFSTFGHKPDMDTDSLRLFVMAADMLNISAAGRELGLAPGTSSARLSKLETEIGADLLHRSTRKVALSQKGLEFLPYAREILAQEDAALAALGNGTDEIQGTLKFAATSTFAQLYVVPRLAEFLVRYPGINFELKLSDLQTNLIERGFDLALRNFAIEDSSVRARKLADDNRILCASPDYLKQYGVPQQPEDLSKHRLLVFMDSRPRELSANGSGRSCTFPPPNARSRVVCDDGASLRIAAKTGVGIGMSSVWSVHNELQDGTLVRVLPDYMVNDQSAIWLVYPKATVVSARVRVFIDFLVEVIGDPPIWDQLNEAH
jgi:DNA-binding transcriptional LysR family regulator